MLLRDATAPIAAEPAAEPPAVALGRRRVVAFVADDVSANALQTGLDSLDPPPDIRRGSVLAAARFLEKVTDVGAILVDVSDLRDPLVELDLLARVCPPDVIVTVIGDSTDIGFYRLLVNSMGVTEYLPKPLTRDAVYTLLRPHFAGYEAESDPVRGGQVSTVCGAQGGAGATSMAVNLAFQLAEATKGNVALLDLHLQDGEAAVMLGLRATSGLRTALEDPLRADGLLLERTAIEVAPRIRLFAADEAMDAELQVTEAGIRHLFALLRRKFNHIVVDLPVPLAPALRPVISVSRHVFVLLQPEVTGLRNARALRGMLTGIAGANRVFTVVNRVDRKGGLTRELIEKGLGIPPDMTIPDLGPRMAEAINQGVPAVRLVPALRRHLSPWVREISGIETAGAPRMRDRWRFR